MPILTHPSLLSPGALAKAPSGKLVTLKPGSYLRAPLRSDSHAPFVHLDEETSALLLDFQGTPIGPSAKSLWHALAGGDVLLVWDDTCLMGLPTKEREKQNEFFKTDT
jgi:hypothetical protein